MTTPVKRRRVPVHGVLLLDKPAGMSSTQALAKAKWLLNAEKAGHTGTLDPFATGLLPLCFGEATKFAADLLDADAQLFQAELNLISVKCDAQVAYYKYLKAIGQLN